MNSGDKVKLNEIKVKSGLQPEIREVKIGDWIKNAERTADDKAGVGGCWKDYWQIFVQQDFPTKCPFCGESLTDGDIDGCHVNIDEKRCGVDSRKWLEKKYIVPGHHNCNVKQDGENQIKITIQVVEAIGK